MWVRGKPDRTIDEGSRRIEEVKAEEDVGIVLPLSGALAAKQRSQLKSPFFSWRLQLDINKAFLLDVN